MIKKSIFWFRRDLRLEDNVGLFHALQESSTVQPIFIFDTDILDKLENKEDARVHFIHQYLEQIHQELNQVGSGLKVFIGKPLAIFKALIEKKEFEALYCNHDYEPYARQRDAEVEKICRENGINFSSYKDQVIFEKDEVLKDDGTPYSVFTPYSRKWKNKLKISDLESYDCKQYQDKYLKNSKDKLPSLEEIGFKESKQVFPPNKADLDIVQNYHQTRDIPSQLGTTRLSVHLRFGTISIRQLASLAKKNNETYLNELIWREFYMMILWHFPHVEKRAFKPKYDQIKWRNNEKEFKAWCSGKTGFPIVDAGMRELNETGFMHNRVRMIVASFLIKDLLIDWRWGEAYFAEKLLDFDLSANNGGWQWAAGSGCDAAPYFRIFNPDSQQKKFDPKLIYIRKWVKEFEDPFLYPKPIVDRSISRDRALNAYKEALA